MEMLLVVGLLAMVSAFTMFTDFSSYRHTSVRSERTILVSVLQKARADALNNVNQEAHGVAISPAGNTEAYVIFEGSSYTAPGRNTSGDIVIRRNYPVTVTGPAEVVFEQLSGDSTFSGDISMSDPQSTQVTAVSINHEGRISW